MKKYLFLSVALMLLATTGCSSDNNISETEEPAQEVQFSFVNEDFGEDETLTRAAATNKPQIVDLGDCEAEITVENEPAAKKTRGATSPATGYYTIRAYQSGTLKGEIKGTFSGGTFIPDAGTKKSIKLSHGNYDFVAFNDDVIVSGNDLTVSREKAKTAMISTVTAAINQDPDQTVTFTMKHVGARLRTQFVCQKDIPENITATLETTAANVIPTSVTYNLSTKSYTATNGAMVTETNNSPASTEAKYSASNYGQNYSYTSTSDYHYFLPTTESSKLKLTNISAGTVFWKPIGIFSVPLLNATLSMQAGKSYVVKIKLKPNYTYLMSDGTTGFLRETIYGDGPKIPIAVILDLGQHMALALKDANEGNDIIWCAGNYVTTWTDTNTHMTPNINDALNGLATSGYDETYDPSYSTNAVTGDKRKGKNPDFPAFKVAADYNSGVTYTGSPELQWYLPSLSDFKWMFSTLGFGNKAAVIKTNQQYGWYGALANSAFTQVGGTPLAIITYYFTSSDRDHSNAGIIHAYSSFVRWDTFPKRSNNRVRPFVRY